MDRETNLRRVRSRTEPWDIVVIGGGATGVGCAVDAASRGLNVLLLEQHDFGKGTSSRSTKLVHGGVRYLAQGDISLVRESLKERGLLLKNAPHLVHRQEFVIPCYSRWQQIFYGAGLKSYDLLAGKHSLGRSSLISREETITRIPNVKTDGLLGGVSYFDGRFDDARLLIDLAMQADECGAALVNYAKVVAFDGTKGTPRVVRFEDALTGEIIACTSKIVINASGAFCDSVRRLADKTSIDIVTLSQGIHIVLDRRFLPGNAALMLPKTSDGRVLFAIPWYGHVIVGTTDTPVAEAELEPMALESEIGFILETAATCLARAPQRSDVRSVFAGIRPLVKSSATRNTSKLSRGHTIEYNGAGLLTITGGKWTTYRRMAEDVVDQAVQIGGLHAKGSVTSDLSIDGPSDSEDVPKRDRLHPHFPYTKADVVRAVRTEMAQTVEDVLARRTRCLFLDAQAAIEIAPDVGEIIGRELGKDGEWVGREIEEFGKTARGYLLS